MGVFEDEYEDDERIYPAEKWSAWMKDYACALVQAALDDRLCAVFAATRIDHARLDRALAKDTSGNAANPNRMIGDLPLTHHAVLRSDLEALKKLVAAGANLEDVDDRGYTALDAAAAAGFRPGRKYLKSLMFTRSNFYAAEDGLAPYNRNFRNRANEALIEALRGNDAMRAKSALLLGASPDARQYDGLSALHLAVLKVNTEALDLLLRAGADVDRRHTRGESTLAMLWWCRTEDLLKPHWYAVRDRLLQGGCTDMFFKTPDMMDARELLQHPPGAIKGARGLDYAVYGGAAAQAFEKIKASPDVALTARDLLAHSALFGESMVSLLRRRDELHLVFAPEIWGLRLGEMHRVWAEVEPLLKYGKSSFVQEDFNRASAAVMQARQKKLKEGRKFQLPKSKGGQP